MYTKLRAKLSQLIAAYPQTARANRMSVLRSIQAKRMFPPLDVGECVRFAPVLPIFPTPYYDNDIKNIFLDKED
jgi:hypothetical protein